MARNKPISWQLALVALLCLSQGALSSEQKPVNDLNLVIAVDCSYSVDSREYELQMAGIAEVFSDPDIARAIEGGFRGSVGVLLVQWSSRDTQIIMLPWTRISSRQSAIEYAALVAPQLRKTADAGTAIASVLRFSHAQLLNAPFTAERNVIDIIADGKDNYGKPVSPVRDEVVADNVTINALAILNQIRELHQYLRERVVGGDGAFVEEADSYEDFAPAFKRKLLREITERGLVGLPPGKWAAMSSQGQ